jgi:hypothetical protein
MNPECADRILGLPQLRALLLACCPVSALGGELLAWRASDTSERCPMTMQMTSEAVSVSFQPTRSRWRFAPAGVVGRVARRRVGVPPAWVVASVAASVSAGGLWSASGSIVALAGLASAVVVGPVVAHVALLWWVGWRVVIPHAFVGVPASSAARGARARRRTRCGRGLSPRRLPAVAWTIRAGRCSTCGESLAPLRAGVDRVAFLVFAWSES